MRSNALYVSLLCALSTSCGASEISQPGVPVEVDGNASGAGSDGAGGGDTNGNGSPSGNDNTNDNSNENTNANANGNSNDNGGISPASTTQFVEADGFIVMEMESSSLTSDVEWDMQAELSGYTGDGYFQFTGNGICSGPANSPLEFTFKVETAGRYELRLRAAKFTHCVTWKNPEDHIDDTSTSGCNHTHGTCTSVAFPTGNECPDPTTQCRRSDISNDAFVQIRDANGEYVTFVDQPGSSVGDGIKLFGGRNNEWGWTGRSALDTNHQKWNARWDLAPGDYTLIVEGRSQMFRIDRMVLFDEGRHSFNNNEFVGMGETLAP